MLHRIFTVLLWLNWLSINLQRYKSIYTNILVYHSWVSRMNFTTICDNISLIWNQLHPEILSASTTLTRMPYEHVFLIMCFLMELLHCTQSICCWDCGQTFLSRQKTWLHLFLRLLFILYELSLHDLLGMFCWTF